MTNMPFDCEICGTSSNSWVRCEEHYRCDKCGSKSKFGYYGHDQGLICVDCHKKLIQEQINNFSGSTQQTPEIVCPYCGYVAGMSFDPLLDFGNQCCDNCENEFFYHRFTEVTYNTSKIKQPDSKGE